LPEFLVGSLGRRGNSKKYGYQETARGLGVAFARIAASGKFDGFSDTGDRPEWPLVKGLIIAGSAFPVAAAVGDFHELVARLIEQRIGFGAVFDGARFTTIGSERN
jgi:hypothetical protein